MAREKRVFRKTGRSWIPTAKQIIQLEYGTSKNYFTPHLIRYGKITKDIAFEFSWGESGVGQTYDPRKLYGVTLAEFDPDSKTTKKMPGASKSFNSKAQAEGYIASLKKKHKGQNMSGLGRAKIQCMSFIDNAGKTVTGCYDPKTRKFSIKGMMRKGAKAKAKAWTSTNRVKPGKASPKRKKPTKVATRSKKKTTRKRKLGNVARSKYHHKTEMPGVPGHHRLT